MAEIEEQQQPTATTSSSSSSLPSKSYAPSQRPTITLPPRSFGESLFGGGRGSASGMGFSPGPMTLVSNLFSGSDDCKSFSQLLAGAVASPAVLPATKFPAEDKRSSAGVEAGRPASLSIVPPLPPPIFTAPPGLSPSVLLDSPGLLGLFSPQGAFGMTHQQALAQVTAQAVQAHSHMHFQPEHSSSMSSAPTTSSLQFSSFTTNLTTDQETLASMPDSKVEIKESSDFSDSDHKSQVSLLAVEKPADDGYNWRKYGQKRVKGCEFPRSYYKCTHPCCPVTKKVECSLGGQVTEIIYKGQHNHQLPQQNRHAKGTGSMNGKPSNRGNFEVASQTHSGKVNKLKDRKDLESSQARPQEVCRMSDSKEVGDTDAIIEKNDEDEPDPKRRSTEVRIITESASSQRTVTEPRIIVQTNSEVDLLDDGYRWRKYGQKIVKGNPYPRSYYKCTTLGCNVRKHVERAAAEPKAVVTTYEGKHSHDVPAAKSSSHNAANAIPSQLRPYNVENHAVFDGRNNNNGNQHPAAHLLLKEEQIT